METVYNFRLRKILKFYDLIPIILVLIFTQSFVNSSYKSQIGGKNFHPQVCETEACKIIASEVLEKMNLTANPCDDFYEFVCGNFSKNAVIPDEKAVINVLVPIQKKIQNDLKSCIEKEIKDSDPETFKILKSYYDTCLNEEQIEKNSTKEIFEILKRLGSWPVLSENSWAETNFDWQKTIQKFRRTGFLDDLFVGIKIETDLKNNSRRIIYIDQASLGTSQEYLSQGLEHEIVQAYFKFMTDVADIFGANRTKATQELKESLLFEIELAKISQSSSQRRDPTSLYNPMSIDQLQLKYPFLRWHEYISTLIFPYTHLVPSDIVSVTSLSFFDELANLINKTPKRVMANYAFWRIVQKFSPALSERVRQAQREFDAALTGNSNKKPRWQECLDHVNRRLPLATGALYVRRRFDKKSKDSAMEMINDLRKSFRQMLTDVDWMEEFTKIQALEKLDEMLASVAYPDELLDDKLLDNYHQDLTVYPESFLRTLLSHKLFDTKRDIENLRKPILRSDWSGLYGAAAVVNAFYDPSSNTIFFPTGILQGAFFNSEHPKYMNYAGIGSIVGHEMTHGFDDQGRLFDKNGNLVDWWDPHTAEEYLKKAECIVNQYGNYTVKEVNMTINGVSTQGENIADNGGLKEAYYAYDAWQKINGEEPCLPGLQQFTPKQLFWISYANIECSKSRSQYLANLIVTDPHTPATFRVIGSVSNMPEFSKDFNCPLGSNMNPINKCTIW